MEQDVDNSEKNKPELGKLLFDMYNLEWFLALIWCNMKTKVANKKSDKEAGT